MVQLVAIDAILDSSDFCDSAIDVARLGPARSELNDAASNRRLFAGGKNTDLRVVGPPIDAVDHDATAFGQFVRKAVANDAPDQTLIVALRIEDRVAAGGA